MTKIPVEIGREKQTEVKINFGEKVEAKISIPKKKTKSKQKKKAKNTKNTDGVKRASAKKSSMKKRQQKKEKSKSELKSRKVVASTKKKSSPEKSKSKKKSKWLKILIIAIGLIIVVIIGLMIFWNIRPSDTSKVVFSKETGLYKEEIEVELSLDEQRLPFTEIRYTLDGDSPITNGKVYNSSIKLEMKEAVNVYPIKAVYCYIGGKCSNVQSATYILAENPEEDITLDLISITSDHKNLYDYETGIMVDGKTYDDNIAKGMSREKEYVPGNYNNRDANWIRNAEIVSLDAKKIKSDFDLENVVDWNQKVGIQISGNTSAANDVKSLKLVANEKYGYNKLAYNFDESGNSTIGLVIPKKYNSLRLRAGGQDIGTGNIRSSIASRLAEQSGFDGYSATKRAVVYLNGDFYGIFDVQQNFSDSFLRKRFGLEDADAIQKIKGTEKEAFLEAGLIGLFQNDLNSVENREKLEQHVDMENFLLYYAIELLWNNTDWPQNSFEMWRYNGAEIPGVKYSDGRWRFLIYDTDVIYYREDDVLSFAGVAGDQFEAIMESKWRAEDSVFRNVIRADYYREKFIEIMRELLDGAFERDNVQWVIKNEAEIIRAAVKLYFSEGKYEIWEEMIERLANVALNQDKQIKDDLMRYFGIRIE